MSNVVEVIKAAVTFIYTADMRVGQIGILHEGSDGFYDAYAGETIMRVFGGFVNLTEPKRSITEQYSHYKVEILPPDTLLQITVGTESFPTLEQLTEEQRDSIRAIRDQGFKIQAIKEVCTLTTAGLKDAKEFVDNL